MKHKIWWIVAAIVLVSALVFAEVVQRGQYCKSVIVNLDPDAEFQFFDEKEIKRLLTANGSEHFEGSLLKDLDLNSLENRVLKNRLIKSCQIIKDLSGNLLVNIKQQRPIARLIDASENEELINIQGRYLTDTGDVVPISGKFTARTLLISGSFFRNLKNIQTDKGKKLVELLNDIGKNPFLKAQITELKVEEDGEIMMLPQVGNYQIEFGLPEEIEAKFKKINIFYKTILPEKGWEKYRRVSVKFRNQIVCE